MRPLPTPRFGLVVLLVAVLLGAPVVGVVGATGGHGPAADTAGPTAGTAWPTPLDGALADRGSIGHLGGASSGAVHGVQSAASDLGDRFAPGPGPGGLDGWELPLPALLLSYTRQVHDEPLSNAVRERIYEQVASTPGAHIAAIVDRSGVARSTARYHLRVLEAADLVVSDTVRGKHRYAMAGDDLRLAAALEDDAVRRVLVAVDRLEPATVTDLADAVDRAPSTVSHHLDTLADDGLVDRQRADGAVQVRLDPAVREALGPVLETDAATASTGIAAE